jgi:phosphonate transport system permease protein
VLLRTHGPHRTRRRQRGLPAAAAAVRRALPRLLVRRRGLALVVASFWSLDLQWARSLSLERWRAWAASSANCCRPTCSAFLRKVLPAALETLAMSAWARCSPRCRLLLALPRAAARATGALARGRRLLLNVLRSVPELMWAALLLIAAGLGPFAGTLALALHTTGVLGRLFAEAIENAAPGPAVALRGAGVREAACSSIATLPQVLPQLVSYTLYRWENNIRAAAMLGVVGAGGLGQMLAFHLGLFQMAETGSVLAAMIVLVALVGRRQLRGAPADVALNDRLAARVAVAWRGAPGGAHAGAGAAAARFRRCRVYRAGRRRWATWGPDSSSVPMPRAACMHWDWSRRWNAWQASRAASRCACGTAASVGSCSTGRRRGGPSTASPT